MKRMEATVLIGAVITLIVAALLGVTVNLTFDATGEVEVKTLEGPAQITIEYAEEQIPATVEDDLGEIIETNKAGSEEILTVEEIDGGGMFSDLKEATEQADEYYYDAGAIESVDTSSFEAFKNATIGRCIIANNYYGAQCVSLARAFWWSYAGYDVSTCGTGLAKGMMNCYEDNAKDRFETIWDTSKIQAGTWIVTDGAYTGHVCMALGPAVNGHVACLGENQGGASCGSGVGGIGNKYHQFGAKKLYWWVHAR